MILSPISITCDYCKKDFSDVILTSIGPAQYEFVKDSDVLTDARKCPHCNKSVDISRGDNYKVCKMRRYVNMGFKGFLLRVLEKCLP